MKKIIITLIAVILLVGCTSQPPKTKSIQEIPSDKKVLVVPVINSDVSISREVTSKMEAFLTEQKYVFNSSSIFINTVMEKQITNEYIAFINGFKSFGVVNTEFLKKFDYDYFIVSVFDYESSDRSFLGSALTESDYERMTKNAHSKLRAGESWSKSTVFMFAKDGSIVFEDSSETKLSAPLKPPKVDQMYVSIISPLMKLPGMSQQ